MPQVTCCAPTPSCKHNGDGPELELAQILSAVMATNNLPRTCQEEILFQVCSGVLKQQQFLAEVSATFHQMGRDSVPRDGRNSMFSLSPTTSICQKANKVFLDLMEGPCCGRTLRSNLARFWNNTEALSAKRTFFKITVVRFRCSPKQWRIDLAVDA